MTSLTIPLIARAKMPSLYLPGADWRDADQYPAIKPSYEFQSADYHRLAWEILRRSPRYRWHYRRIKESGLLESRAFGAGHYYFASREGKFLRIPNWQSIVLDSHNCSPPAAKGQLLGDYAEKNEGNPWLVVHGPRWALNLWGISEFVDPTSGHDDEMVKMMFAPSVPSIVSPSIDIVGSPGPLNCIVAPQEIYIKFRLDNPASEQGELAGRLLEKAQRAGKPRTESFGQSVRLKHVEVASYWLRCWDAAQLSHSNGAAKFDRKEFVRRLELDVSKLASRLRDAPLSLSKKRQISKVNQPSSEAVQGTSQSRKPVQTVADFLHDALSVDRIDKWLLRSKKYIETDHDFYRRVLAKAYTAWS